MPPESKTLPMRLLEQAGLTFQVFQHTPDPSLSGAEVARQLGRDPAQVFKTLVTQGKSRKHYVFVIPVAESLDLKKAALACGEKAVEMIPQKALLPLTGYVHGGCSPLGMKKQFPTFIDETAILHEAIYCNAGRVGTQLKLPLASLQALVPIQTADLVAI